MGHSRGLSQHPGPGDGEGITCTELCRGVAAPTTAPGCTVSISTEVNAERGRAAPLDCIDRVGFAPAFGLFGLQLSCIFPFAAAFREAGAPRVQLQTRSPLGFVSTVKSRATASGSLQSPGSCRLRWEHHRAQAAGAACSFAPDCPGCWGQLGFWESPINSLEAPNGDGVGRQQRCRSLENQKCFRDIHSASQHLPGGRGRAVPRAWDRGKELVLSTGSPPWDPHTLCASRGRAMCFPRDEAPALGFSYCSWSEDTVGVAGARHGGGSLAGGTWTLGCRRLAGITEPPNQHRQVQGWQGHSQPGPRGELPTSHLC